MSSVRTVKFEAHRGDVSEVATLISAEPPTGKHSRRAWRHWYADQRRISRRDGQFVCRFGRFFWVAETRAEKPMARRMAKVVHRALRTHDAAMAFGAFVNGRKVETLGDVRALLRAFLSPEARLSASRAVLLVHDADGTEREIDGMVAGWAASRSREVFETLTSPVDDSAIKSLRFKTVNEIRGEQGLPPVEDDFAWIDRAFSPEALKDLEEQVRPFFDALVAKRPGLAESLASRPPPPLREWTKEEKAAAVAWIMEGDYDT